MSKVVDSFARLGELMPVAAAPEYEQRLNQIPYPRIATPDGEMTHKMAAEVDESGNWYAFPTVQPDERGQLVEMELRAAQAKAMRERNYKAFGQDKDAALGYAEGGYKQGTVIEPQYSAQPLDQTYIDYVREQMEARSAADMFTQMRSQKAGYWEARRQDLLDMVDSIGRAQ